MCLAANRCEQYFILSVMQFHSAVIMVYFQDRLNFIKSMSFDSSSVHILRILLNRRFWTISIP